MNASATARQVRSSKPRAKTKPKNPKGKRATTKLKTAEVVEVQAVAEQLKAATSSVVTQEQIGQRAYEIWLLKGRPYGQDQANWDQAAAELLGDTNQAN